MRNLLIPVSLSLLSFNALYSCAAEADERQAKMSVTVIASGSDSTHSEGESSKGTYRYKAVFDTILQTDGEPSDVNMYDPQYAEKAMAAANASMAKVQAALRGEFSDDEEEEQEPDNRYLFFIGQMECPSTLSIEVDERLEGEYADVGGMQPYVITYTAKSSGAPAELNMLCVGNTSVLDIKDDILYRSNIGFPEVTGHYVYHETNRGNLQDNPESRHSALPSEISDYVFNTLRVAPASGHVKTTLKPTQPVLTRINTFGGYEGSVDVEITWKFEMIE
jgi:hypothetical protein